MYISFFTLLGALLGYVIVKGRDERNAENKQQMRDAGELARAKANSPYRLACPSCGSPAGEACTAIGGVSPWQPHPERMRALHMLREEEFKAEYPASQRAY